jgi:arsenate reductase
MDRTDCQEKTKMKRVLFVCTENAARSQIAEGLLRFLGKDQFEVMSAGIEPADEVHPLAITVMRERAIDTEGMTTKQIDDDMLQMEFDLVVTVCDHARDHCPAFPNAKASMHWSIPDPVKAKGTHDELLEVFRRARSLIEKRIRSEILS